MPWRRPDSVPLGTVWRRFKGRARDGQPVFNYQIRDIQQEDRKPCLDMMQKVFLRDEPLCELLDVPSDPLALKTIRRNWQKYLDEQLSLACYTENENGEPDMLVAFNILYVISVDDLDDDPVAKAEGESWRKLLRTLIAAEETCDVFDRYDVDKYLSSSGLTVLPEHRGQNIGAEMFKAREPLCKVLGIKATATVFTASTSQTLAAKCGYEVLGELKYEEMMQQGVDVRGCPTPSAKLMGTKFL